MTSTDRELLELAAKAHGAIPLRVVCAAPGLYCCDEPGKPRTHPQWNPLTDDGDALRLAVKLGIAPNPAIGAATFAYVRDRCDIYEPHCGDPYAATRRAIVRAAAEIGMAQP